MAKKNFSKGISAILGDEPLEKKEEKQRENQEKHLAVKDLNNADLQTLIEKKVTFIMDIDQLEKVKALAYWERAKNKDILREALDFFFSSKEDRLKEAVKNYKTNETQKTSV